MSLLGNIVSAKKAELLGGIGVDLKEWGFTPPTLDPVTFVLVARILREKGVIEFCEAARRVKAQRLNTRFLLLGGLDENPGGISESELRGCLESGAVEWHGHVSVKPYLAQSSVFVLPSYYREGVPRSTQEAMAMGRAIITTDVPGCRETVIEGFNGIVVPIKDAHALAGAMIRFIDEPELIQRMGQCSRELAEEKFDVDKINVKLMHMLELPSAA